MRRIVHPLALAAWCAILLSVALTGIRLATSEPSADAMRYRSMTTSLLATGEFRADHVLNRAPQPGEEENGYTHYFSPLWPMVMVPFSLGGHVGFEIAYIAACAAALGTIWWTTRRLYGDAAAFGCVALVGLSLSFIASQRGAEPLALIFFTLMMGAIVDSVRPGLAHRILYAGLFAGFAYLTRASVGWLFLLGGGAGFAWRLYFHQRRALNRHYLAAIGIFAACWGLWATRNMIHFWDGTVGGLSHGLASDAVFEWKFQRALDEPGLLVALIPAKVLFGLAMLSPVLALRSRALWKQARTLSHEETSGLFLGWTVPLVTGAMVAAIFTIADVAPASPLVNLDNLRYFVFCLPALLWGPWRQAVAEPATQRTPGGVNA